MNALTAVPTVEQINLEHKLANSKAAEAVQHATNCGLMLLQVKASLNHGEWLPWLRQQQESGAILFTERTASKYMRIASNRNHGSDLPEAPSIRAALELLSDKDPDEQQGTLIDIEAERKAREAAEAKAESERQARLIADQRAREFGDESNDRRKKIRELEAQIDLLKAAENPEPVVQIQVVEKTPDDYETIKAKAAQLEADLAANKAEQDRIIQNAIKAKLQGYQSEVDALEAKKRNLEQQAKDYQDYLASLTGATRQMEAQSRAFEKTRQALVDLASELADFYPVSHDLNCKAISLAEMHENAAQSLRAVFNDDDGNSPAGIMRWFDQWNRLTGEGNK